MRVKTSHAAAIVLAAVGVALAAGLEDQVDALQSDFVALASAR